MKSIYKPLVAAIALMGSLTSCSDFLTVDPVDKLTQDNFYTSDDRVRLNTATLYASATWDQFSHDFQWKFDMLSGDMFYTYSAEGQWYFGTYTSVNQYINQGWEGLYNVIAFANSIIHDMPGKCQSGVSEAAILQAQAEARCVRAYCYYMLTEAWTNVPVVENNSENITSNNLQLPPATQKSIYEFILKDLNFAAENLPMTDKDSFRATRLTALAIRAKVELTMASHTDMGFDRAALFAAAAADAKTVIDNTYLFGEDAPYPYPRAMWTPWQATGSYDTGNKWVTVSIPLTDFNKDRYMNPCSRKMTSDDFAGLTMIVCWGPFSEETNVPVTMAIDNIRVAPLVEPGADDEEESK